MTKIYICNEFDFGAQSIAASVFNSVTIWIVDLLDYRDIGIRFKKKTEQAPAVNINILISVARARHSLLRGHSRNCAAQSTPCFHKVLDAVSAFITLMGLIMHL